MSKGSKFRPMNISYKEYGEKWDKIFGDKLNNKSEECNCTCGCCDDEIKPLQNINNEFELLRKQSLEVEIERIKQGHA